MMNSYRRTVEIPVYRDEAEKQRQLEKRQEEIAAYRAERELVEARRAQDRQDRNNAKIQQLQLAEHLQVCQWVSLYVYGSHFEHFFFVGYWSVSKLKKDFDMTNIHVLQLLLHVNWLYIFKL